MSRRDVRAWDHRSRGIGHAATDAGVLDGLLRRKRMRAGDDTSRQNKQPYKSHGASTRETTPRDAGHTRASSRYTTGALSAGRWGIGRSETIEQALASGGPEQSRLVVWGDDETIGQHAMMREQGEHRGHRPVARPTHRTRRACWLLVTGVTRVLAGLVLTTAMHGTGGAVRHRHGTISCRVPVMTVLARRDGRASVGRTAVSRDKRRKRRHLEEKPDRCPETDASPTRTHGAPYSLLNPKSWWQPC